MRCTAPPDGAICASTRRPCTTVALLLCHYARSEKVFDYAEQRLQLRPLALLYGEALEAPQSA